MVAATSAVTNHIGNGIECAREEEGTIMLHSNNIVLGVSVFRPFFSLSLFDVSILARVVALLPASQKVCHEHGGFEQKAPKKVGVYFILLGAGIHIHFFAGFFY